MTKVKLFGELGKKFGKDHEFLLDKLSQFGSAMEANNKGFVKFLTQEPEKNGRYCLFIDGNMIDSKKSLQSYLGGVPKEIVIIPFIGGSTYFIPLIATYIAESLFVAGSTAALVTEAVVSLVLYAVVSAVVTSIFAPKPKSSLQASTANAGLNSYYFGGRQNKAQQGQPVPVVYGLLTVGSYVIQAGIRNLDKDDFEDLEEGSGTSITGTFTP